MSRISCHLFEMKEEMTFPTWDFMGKIHPKERIDDHASCAILAVSKGLTDAKRGSR